MNAQKRDLVGRKIVDINFRRHRTSDECGNVPTSDPTITLDNGDRLFFTVDEDEGGYGITIGIVKAPKTAKKGA